jgi:hypothetical protein
MQGLLRRLRVLAVGESVPAKEAPSNGGCRGSLDAVPLLRTATPDVGLGFHAGHGTSFATTSAAAPVREPGFVAATGLQVDLRGECDIGNLAVTSLTEADEWTAKIAISEQ